MTRVKLWLVMGTALLALPALEPAARAQRVNFIYTGTLDTFTVPETGTYQIVAFGAQGGDSNQRGGRGAEIGGNFLYQYANEARGARITAASRTARTGIGNWRCPN